MIGIMQEVLITYYMSSEEGNVHALLDMSEKESHRKKSMEG